MLELMPNQAHSMTKIINDLITKQTEFTGKLKTPPRVKFCIMSV